MKFLPGEDRKFIEEAEAVMLHRLHPYPYASGRPKEGVERFHGYEILGTTKVEDAEIREALVVDLYRGIASSDGTVAACFSPRHGVRFTRGNDAIDLVICFECLQVKAYKGEQQRSALTTRLPEATYRFALRRAGIDIKEDE